MSGIESRIWPFLIGRGVTTGNRLLLVPDCLNGDAVELLDEVGAPPSGSERSVSVVDVGGATVVHEARFVDRDDVINGGDRAGERERSGDELLRDEHGRPIRVLYGFVVPDGMVEHLDRNDLVTSWDHAVDTYRSFHGNESAFQVQRSQPITARSIIFEQPSPGPDPSVGRIGAATTGADQPDEARAYGGGAAAPTGRRTHAGPLVGAFAAVVVVVMLFLQFERQSPPALSIEPADEGCVLRVAGDPCLYDVSASIEGEFLVKAEIVPSTFGDRWEVERDENCLAVTTRQPCEIAVRAASVGVMDAGDGSASLRVWAENTDFQVHLALPVWDPGQERPSPEDEPD